MFSPWIWLTFLLNPTTSYHQPQLGTDAMPAFFDHIAKHCGAYFEGYSSFPTDPNDSFAGKLLVAEVTSCKEDEIRIAFAVGKDRSRTWILTKSHKGLLLKHDHRHADGTPDEITMYGGWASKSGTAHSQSFAADEYTITLIPAAATNVWTLSLDPQTHEMTYYLERNGQPRFKATLKKKPNNQ